MIDEKEIQKKVCRLVSEHLSMPIKEVEACVDVPFTEYPDDEDGMPYCDSMDRAALLTYFEDEYGVKILYEEAERELVTINDVVRYVASNCFF